MSKTALNEKNLASLGDERLADIILYLIGRRPAEERRLHYQWICEFDPYALADVLKEHQDSLLSTSIDLLPEGAESFLSELFLQRDTIIQLESIDPHQAIEALFHLLHRKYLWQRDLFRNDDYHHIFSEQHIKQIQDFNGELHLLLIALLRQHRPQPKFILHCFFDLPHDGYPFIFLIENVLEFLGDDGVSLLDKKIKKRIKHYASEIKKTQKKSIIDQAKMHHRNMREFHSFLPLFRKDANLFLRQKLTKSQLPKTSDNITDIALDLRDMGLIEGAEACLTAIPTPPPQDEHQDWYWTYNIVLNDLNQIEQAQKLRWEYVQGVKSFKAAYFYLKPFQSSKEDYEKNFLLIVHKLMDDFDVSAAGRTCDEARKYIPGDTVVQAFTELVVRRVGELTEDTAEEEDFSFWSRCMCDPTWILRAPLAIMMLTRHLLVTYIKTTQNFYLKYKIRMISESILHALNLYIKISEEEKEHYNIKSHDDYMAYLNSKNPYLMKKVKHHMRHFKKKFDSWKPPPERLFLGP